MRSMQRFVLVVCLVAVQSAIPAGSRNSSVAKPRGVLGSLAAFTLSPLLLAEVKASCNLIPVAARTFPSELGGVVSPISAPGKTVEIVLKGCDQSDGFEPLASDNKITLTFTPPDGPTAVVEDVLAGVTGLCADLCSDAGEACGNDGDCSCPSLLGPGERCLTNVISVDCAGGSCNELTFVMPKTDVGLPAPCTNLPLSGPVTVTVKNLSSTVVAQIGRLYQPTDGCDKARETVFEDFTVLPPPNDARYLADNPGTQILATVDGGNNLLIPVNWLDVLPNGPGSPVARFMDGEGDVTAFMPRCSETAGPCAVDSDCPPAETCEPAQSLSIPSSDFVRSFTLDGRPLPPLLRADDTGGLVFGTADAAESVIRISRTDPTGATPDIFDFTDRLCCGQGPIILNSGSSYPGGACGGGMSAAVGTYAAMVTTGSITVTEGEEVPLRGLHSSVGIVAYTGNDGLVRVVDAASGVNTPSPLQVFEVSSGPVSKPALEVSGSLAALLEPQPLLDPPPLNVNTASLHVLGPDGNDLTSSFSLPAVPAPRVNGSAMAISDPFVFFRAPGSRLSFVEAHFDGVAGVDGLGGAQVPAVSPDGANVYVTGLFDSAVAVFSRDPTTGALTFIEAQFDGVAGVDGLEGATGVAVSPDGANVYVTGNGENALAVFSRDAGTGALTWKEAHFDGVGGVDGLGGALDVAVSPDGKNVYVTALENALAVFSRDAGTGALTWMEAHFDGVGGVDGLGGALDVAVSPDGKNVYVAGQSDFALAVFSRDAGTGALTWMEAHFDGVGGVDGLAGATTAAVSPDGKHVYVTAGDDDAVAVFSRNSTTGELSFSQAHALGALADPIGLALGPDGAQVYVMTAGLSRVELFSRNPTTGALTFVEAEAHGVRGVDGLGLPVLVAVSPDGANVYVASAGSGAVAVFRVAAGLQVFDTAADPPVPPATVKVCFAGSNSGQSCGEDSDCPGGGAGSCRGDASVVAVASQRAALLIPEGNGGGADLNGDADFEDQVAYLYDAALTSLDVAANRVAISAGLVAVTVPEVGQPGFTGNSDGDPDDDVLAVNEIGTLPPPDNVGVAADSIAVTQVCFGGDKVGVACSADSDCPSGTCHKVVVLITPEAAEGATATFCQTPAGGGCNLNGDGDSADRVLRVYDHTAGQIVEIGQAAEEFVVGGRLVAFRTGEAAQKKPGEDGVLNGDGDTNDLVMQVYDIARDVIFETGQAAVRCDRPGCEQFSPYGIKGDTVFFITDETGQAEDLNHNGRRGVCVGGPAHGDLCEGNADCAYPAGTCRGDIVLQVFNTVSGEIEVYDLTQEDLSQDPGCALVSPLPQQFLGGTILYVEKKEFELGIDLNGDGDTDDCVILLAGDTDEDGTFDDNDTCVETENPGQDDLDLDVLGDVCDPRVACSAYVPAAPPVVSASEEKCQKAIGKAAAAYLKRRGVAVRKCLDRIAKGDLSGNPTAVCRGSFVGDVEIPPEDAGTALKFFEAADKFLASVQAKCASQAVVPPAACGSTASELVDCVVASYGTGVNAASERAYGDVTSLNPSLGKCQVAVGKASAKYLKSVTKAMQGCLDRINKGKLAGNSQALCLGSLGDRCVGGATPGSPCCPGGGLCDGATDTCIGGTNDGLSCSDACGGAACEVGLAAPTDSKTAQKIQKADDKLRKVVTNKCPPGTLNDVAMDVCGTDAAAAGDCLTCDHWRQAVEAIGSAYGRR